MDAVTTTGILNTARSAVDAGRGLAGTGFWKLVSEVKKDPVGNARFIPDISEIDQKAFRNWALLEVSLGLGTALMVLGTVVGLVAVGLAYPTSGTWSAVWLLLGAGILIVATHGLAHLVVGSLVGIDFTAWFIGTIGRPQPGVKTDYSSYLNTPARSRAWMHASGALMTKVLPFLLVGAGIAADTPNWAWIVLIVFGVVSIIIDVLWSTKASDWKRFSREMNFV